MWKPEIVQVCKAADSDSDDLSGEGHEVAVASALDIVTDATTLQLYTIYETDGKEDLGIGSNVVFLSKRAA